MASGTATAMRRVSVEGCGDEARAASAPTGAGGVPVASKLRLLAAQGATAMRCAEAKSADLLITREGERENVATVLAFI
eukprot:5064822-Pleurochrysis_carterae.AAC.1